MNTKLCIPVLTLALFAALPALPAIADDAAPSDGTTRIEIIARDDRGATQRIDLTLATPDVNHRSDARIRDLDQRGYAVSIATRMSHDGVLMAEVDVELYDDNSGFTQGDFTRRVIMGKRVLLGRLPDAGNRGLQVMMTMR